MNEWCKIFIFHEIYLMSALYLWDTVVVQFIDAKS